MQWTRWVFRVFGVAVLTVWSAVPVSAKSPISPAFDGRYHITTYPIASLSKPDCQPFMITATTISNGLLTGAPSAGAAVQGIVTKDGFLSGALLRPGKPRMTFEGRFIDGKFSGAAIDSAAGCSWTITFAPAP